MATTTARPAKPKPGGTATPAAPEAPAGAGQESTNKPKRSPGKSRRKKILLALPVLLILAVAAKMTLLGGGAKPVAAPKAGPIVSLDPVTVNLAASHYLRIGVAVQFTDQVSAAAPPPGAPAIDQTIAYFTGRDAGPLETAAGLTEAKQGLKGRIAAAYPDDPVFAILITSFVVQ